MPDQLMDYLPAIYQEAGPRSFLAILLAAMEKILVGRKDAAPLQRQALEETIAALVMYLDPKSTPREFLPWLGQWVGLTIRTYLDEQRQREVIAKIVPLYRVRGTPHGIADMIRLFTGGTAIVREPEDYTFQIRVNSTIGHDTYLGGTPPFTFHVTFFPAESRTIEPEHRERADEWTVEIVRWVIEMSKPAHTQYTLDIRGESQGVLRQGSRKEPPATRPESEVEEI
jgi:phage tail-like protein